MVDQRWSEPPTAWAVQTRGLRKRFGNVVAVDDMSLHVPLGGVHGLLGPNGSGKTTTLRMLLGLLRAQGGHMEILGHEVPKHLPEVIPHIGSIVEQPRFAPRMTLRRNLEILAVSIGVPRFRVTEVLLEVGLAARAESRFQTCSLGMKQRLAIAATLLKGPTILIFDEPTNGLDPAGIHEVRTTMRELAAEGHTVVISSHLLSEIEQIADSLSIIGRGRVLAEGHLQEFLATAKSHVVIGIDRPHQAAEVLRKAGYKPSVEADQVIVEGNQDVATIARTLGNAHLWPHHLSSQQARLEDVFLQLTAEEHLTATQAASRQEHS